MSFRYFGIPMVAEKLKVIHYSPLIDNIDAYLNACTSATLSYTVRTELIRAVLQGVEYFWLSHLPYSESCL